MVDPHYMSERELENELNAWQLALKTVPGTGFSVVSWLAREFKNDGIRRTAYRRYRSVGSELAKKRNHQLDARRDCFDWLAPLLHVDPGERP